MRAAIGRIVADQEMDQRGLAGAVRSDDADPVAALDAGRKSVDDFALAKGLGDVLGLDDELAGFLGFGGSEAGIAGRATVIAPLVAQRMQIAEPLDVALAAAGDAVAQPVFFVDDLAVELVLVAFFFRQHLVAPGLERREAAVDLPDLAAIEPGGRARQVGEEAAVVADDDERAFPALQFAFQPFDGRQIKMVGRLVQQQDVGRGRQHPRQRRAAGLAAGDMRGVFVAGEPELLHQIARLVMIVAGAKASLDIGQRRLVVAEIRLLRQIADGCARLHEAAAAVGLDKAGGDLEQRRLAGAVAADQADALARGHRQLDARQQRRAAEGQPDIFQLDQRRRHRVIQLWSRRGLLRPLALDAADGLVERRQKCRAVARGV